MVNNYNKYFVLLFILLFNLNVHSQEEKEAFYPCLDSIFSNFKTKTLYRNLNINVKKAKIELSENSNCELILKDKQLIEWLQKMNNDSLKVYRVLNGRKEFYLFYSQNNQATGLAINFTSFLILKLNDTKASNIFTFESLSSDKRLIYLDDVFEKINYFKITYGENFFLKRDWDNVDFKIESNIIRDDVMKTEKVTNRTCS
jgi:hypothetical protein